MIERFWKAFLKSKKLNEELSYYECFYYGNSERTANGLVELTLNGKKQATCSSLSHFETRKKKIPKVGDYSIITDWIGNPKCVIETMRVILLPFNKMTYEICRREGESEDLMSWSNYHRRYFKEEGKKLGYEFQEDMLIVFEDFEVVYQ